MSFTLAVFCWLFLLLAAGAACRALLSTVFSNDKWSYLFFPGIACRRVISVAAILLSGGAVTHASLFDPPLRGVDHEPSAVPIAPGIFCALAPLFGSVLLLGLWVELLGNPIAPLGVPWGLGDLRGFVAGVAVILVDSGEAIVQLDYTDPLTWLLLYGGLNLATMLSTEKDDPLLAALGLAVLLLVLGVFDRVWGGVDGALHRLLVGQTGLWSQLVVAVTLSLGVLTLAGLSALMVKISRALQQPG